MLTALALRRAGYAVTLLERGQVGRESSWAGGGILSPLYPWRYPDAVNALARCSQALYPALIEQLKAETGVDAELLVSGLLMLDTEPTLEAPAAAEPAMQCWAVRFDAQIHALDRKAMDNVQPGLNATLTQAWWMPQIMQVRNPRLLRALRVALDVHGVRVLEHVEVQALVSTHGRIGGVRLPDQLLAADAVVVTAGAWSAGLLAGMPTPPAIEPVRGQMILFNAPHCSLKRMVMRGGRYLIPRKDGRVLAGSTVEQVGFDKATSSAARDELRAFALDVYPALADSPIEAHWAGLRPGSPNGIPYIGAHPEIEGLFIHAGHYRNGLVMAPASTEVLLQSIANPSQPTPYAWMAAR